jgi:hypothetical protein
VPRGEAAIAQRCWKQRSVDSCRLHYLLPRITSRAMDP